MVFLVSTYSVLIMRYFVLFFILGFCVPAQSFAQVDQEITSKSDKFIFSAGIATSWRIAKSDANTPAEEEYFKDLKRGTVFRLKGFVPLDDQSSAIGLTFSNYNSREAQLLGLFEEHSISFIGIAYQQYGKFGVGDNNLYNIDYSLGYMTYKSSINSLEAFTGGNVGLSMGLGYRLLVSPSVGIGFDLHFEGTTIGKWEASNGQTFDLEERDNLFRIDFGLSVDIRL